MSLQWRFTYNQGERAASAVEDMRVPKESLDDFASRADKLEIQQPPPAVSPRRSGNITVLKPLVRWEDFEKAKAAHDRKFRWPVLPQLSFFHRSIAVSGVGAFVAFILAMTVYFGFSAQPVEQAASTVDLIASRQKKRPVTPPKARNPFDHLAVSQSPAILEEPVVVPAIVFHRRPARPHVVRADYRVRRVIQRPQLAMNKFVPTTLIIYVEKGEVKSRIEPQLTASYKKQIGLPN
jgi:hypothetical protein